MTHEQRNTIDDATHDEWVAASRNMKMEISKEWCEKSAKIEGDAAVGAGLPSALGLPKLAAPSGALALAPGSARMTLMRGTPDEIERDLAAIDKDLTRLRKENEELRLLCADYDFQRDTVFRLQNLLLRWERWATAHGHDIGVLDDTRREISPNRKDEPRPRQDGA